MLQSNPQLTYADYSPEQHKMINELVQMCSEMDNSSIDHLGGILKVSIIAGKMSRRDAIILLRSDPYLMRVVMAGLKTSITRFENSLRDKPIRMRLIFDALLHYSKLIISDYLKHREVITKLTTHKVLVKAMYATYSQIPARKPITPIFGGAL